MTPIEIIADLDAELTDDGEDIILRRPSGTGAAQTFNGVTVRAVVKGVSDKQISAGISQAELNFIISPTQIDAANWPGTPVADPPFDVDPRVPVPQKDQIIAGGKVRTVTFIDAVTVNGVLVRINGRMTG